MWLSTSEPTIALYKPAGGLSRCDFGNQWLYLWRSWSRIQPREALQYQIANKSAKALVSEALLSARAYAQVVR